MNCKKYTKPGEALKKSLIKNKHKNEVGEKANDFQLNIE